MEVMRVSWKAVVAALAVVLLGGWFVQQSLGSAASAPHIARGVTLATPSAGDSRSTPPRPAAQPGQQGPQPDGHAVGQGGPGSADPGRGDGAARGCADDLDGDDRNRDRADAGDRNDADDDCDDIDYVGPGPHSVHDADGDDTDGDDDRDDD